MTGSISVAPFRDEDLAAVGSLGAARFGPAPEDHDNAGVVLRRDGRVVGYLHCGQAVDLDEPELAELTIAAVEPSAVPTDALDEAVRAAGEHGARRVVTTVAGADEEGMHWLSAQGFTEVGEVRQWVRPSGAPVTAGDDSGRFQMRRFEPGEPTADALLGLAAGTFGQLVFPAPERLVVREDVVRRAVFGATFEGTVLVAIEGWPAVGWALLGHPDDDGEADLVLVHAQAGYEAQGVIAGLLRAVTTEADAAGLVLRVTADPAREAELAEALPDFGFAATDSTRLWSREVPGAG